MAALRLQRIDGRERDGRLAGARGVAFFDQACGLHDGAGRAGGGPCNGEWICHGEPPPKMRPALGEL